MKAWPAGNCCGCSRCDRHIIENRNRARKGFLYDQGFPVFTCVSGSEAAGQHLDHSQSDGDGHRRQTRPHKFLLLPVCEGRPAPSASLSCAQCHFQNRVFHPLFHLCSTSFLALPQLSFLEFFEILLGCAQVRCVSSRELKKRQTPTTTKTESREDSSALTDSCFPSVRASPSS